MKTRRAPRDRQRRLSLAALAPGTRLVAPGAPRGSIPEAHAIRACAGAGAYWPTMTLALQGQTAWIACKEQAASAGCGFRAAADGERAASTGR